MTVAELLSRISSRELAEWQAFFMFESEQTEEKMNMEELKLKALTKGRQKSQP